MGITLKEIAKKSGFGYGTVSRALSDDPYLVKKDTREKICKIAREYGYVKNVFAKALVSGITNDVGLVIPAIFASIFYRDFYTKVMSGVLDALNESEHKLRVIFLKEKVKIENILEEIKEMRLKGIILSPYCDQFIIPEEDILRMDINVVVLGFKVEGQRLTSIMLNDFKGGYDGTIYLQNLGHKKIAVIRGFRDDIEKRYKGFRKAMSDARLKVYSDFIMKGDALEGSGYELTLELLEKKTKPTAIFCLDDEMAFGAIRAIKKKGLRCPEDISILGFDGIAVGGYMDPPLTTMDRPVYKMARKAVEVIVGSESFSETIEFNAEIIERGTCGNV